MPRWQANPDAMAGLLNETAPWARWSRRCSRSWDWIRLLSRRSPAGFYTHLGDDVIDGLDEGFRNPSKPLWLNLGYWRHERTYEGACTALALLLGEAAELQAGDTVLDVGFGYAEQDRLWLERYGLRRIVGINVTPIQVDVGRRRLHQRGLEERIELKLGTATDLPFAGARFDKLVALESAFHFKTREAFFTEAWRVLSPGGRLAMTDMLPLPGVSHSGARRRLVRRRVKIPEENMYDRFAYFERLKRQGFRQVEVRSIARYVYPGMAKYAEARLGGAPISRRIDLADEAIAACRGVETWLDLAGIGDYVVVTARKPVESEGQQ